MHRHIPAAGPVPRALPRPLRHGRQHLPQRPFTLHYLQHLPGGVGTCHLPHGTCPQPRVRTPSGQQPKIQRRGLGVGIGVALRQLDQLTKKTSPRNVLKPSGSSLPE